MPTLLHSVPPALQQATANPRLQQRLWNTHGKVWVSLLWGHCSFLLGPGMHKLLFVPSESLFPLSCVSSGGSLVGLMAAFSKEGLCNTQVHYSQSPCPCDRPLLTHTSAGDTQTQLCLSLCGVSGSCCTQGIFEPSEHLWWVWSLILKAISPTILLGLLLCPWTWVSPHSRSSGMHSLIKQKDIWYFEGLHRDLIFVSAKTNYEMTLLCLIFIMVAE